MVRLIFRLIYWLQGWKTVLAPEVNIEEVRKCVILAAPHTSNWDIVFAKEGCRRMGIKMRFAIKREWMKFPLNIGLGPMGAIPIDRRPKDKRDKKISMVDAMAKLFEGRDELAVMIPPEGTRSLTTKWRTGFYYTAMKANVPIVLCYVDFAKKEAGAGKIIYPTGDVEKDMKEIMAFYKNITPKIPELFALDERYI